MVKVAVVNKQAIRVGYLQNGGTGAANEFGQVVIGVLSDGVGKAAAVQSSVETSPVKCKSAHLGLYAPYKMSVRALPVGIDF